MTLGVFSVLTHYRPGERGCHGGFFNKASSTSFKSPGFWAAIALSIVQLPHEIPPSSSCRGCADFSDAIPSEVIKCAAG